MSKTAVITGAGKGLGLELVKKALSEGYNVAAVTIPMTDALRTLADESGGRVVAFEVDVTDAAAINECKQSVENKFDSISVIINNAGIWLDFERFELEDERFDIDMCYKEFDVNAMGVLRITKAFMPLLRKSDNSIKALVNLSSDCASYQSDNWRKSEYAYCMSKSCVNIISILMNNTLKDTDIKVFSVFPGWMQTDMGYAGPGNPQPDVHPSEAAECIFNLIENVPKKEYVFCDRFGNKMY